MDRAVALVQAYLRLNGFFTVTEFPVLERKEGSFRALTDLDVLAVRFAGAEGYLERTDEEQSPDPELVHDPGRMNMLIAEVKEGKPEFNPGAFSGRALRRGLLRFGCCEPSEIDRVIDEFHSEGKAGFELQGGECRLQFIAFGTSPGGSGNFTVIRLGRVRRYLEDYLKRHWEALRTTELEDPALGMLQLLRKAGIEPEYPGSGAD